MTKVVPYNLVVFGQGGVGKSAITIQYVQQHFETAYDPTIEDAYSKRVKIDTEICELEILDTAGQDELSAMRDQYFTRGEGFLLVFAINNRDSFREIANFHSQMVQTKGANDVPFILVGNKCDLEDERRVSTNEARSLAQTLGTTYIETSAKTRVNINEAFALVVRAVREYRKQHPSNHIVKNDETSKCCCLL